MNVAEVATTLFWIGWTVVVIRILMRRIRMEDRLAQIRHDHAAIILPSETGHIRSSIAVPDEMPWNEDGPLPRQLPPEPIEIPDILLFGQGQPPLDSHYRPIKDLDPTIWKPNLQFGAVAATWSMRDHDVTECQVLACAHCDLIARDRAAAEIEQLDDDQGRTQ